MSNFFSSLANIGGNFVGGAIESGLDYIYGALPTGLQSTLSSVGNFFDIGSSDIGEAAGNMTRGLLNPGRSDLELKDLPSAGAISGSNFSSRGGFQAGQAQMMPFGKTDRVSRAMQDPRVADKLRKMAQGRLPSPNMRRGSNISLASAKIPTVSLARKYSRG
jgi:hypothetical protein